MQYRIEFISGRFDRSESARSDNVNQIAGSDLLKYLAAKLSISDYDSLNEDWGRGIAYKIREEHVEISVSEYHPGTYSFGRLLPSNGPNWVILVSSYVMRKKFFVFEKKVPTITCQGIGVKIKEILSDDGDVVTEAGIEIA